MKILGRGRWPPLGMGIVAPVAVGGSLLALGVWGSAPALAGWGCLNLVAALGVYLRTRWGFLLEALLGIVLCAITGFVAAFSVLMLMSERGSLDDPMFGTGIVGALNGWASLALYGLLLAAGVVMIAAAWRGLKDRPDAGPNGMAPGRPVRVPPKRPQPDGQELDREREQRPTGRRHLE